MEETVLGGFGKVIQTEFTKCMGPSLLQQPVQGATDKMVQCLQIKPLASIRQPEE